MINMWITRLQPVLEWMKIELRPEAEVLANGLTIFSLEKLEYAEPK